MHLEDKASRHTLILKSLLIFLATIAIGYFSKAEAQYVPPEVVYSAYELTSPYDLGREVEYDNYAQAAATAVKTWCIIRGYANCAPVRQEMDWEYPLTLSGVDVPFTSSTPGVPNPAFTSGGLATRVVCPPGASYYWDIYPGLLPGEGLCNISNLSISEAVLTSVSPANPTAAGRPANSFSVTPAVTSSTLNASDGKKALSWVCKGPNGAVVANATFELSSHQATPGSGGHIHNSGRPKGTFSALTGSANASGVWNVQYTATEIGGIETFKAKCSAPNFTANVSTWTAYIEMPGLVALPDNPQMYTFVGRFADKHVENNFGTPELNRALVSLASEFTKWFPGKLIHYNDMSLPYGGLFDFAATWSRGTDPDNPEAHGSHRRGIDVDVDHDGLSQKDFRYLRQAVRVFRLEHIREGKDNHTHLRLR